MRRAMHSEADWFRWALNHNLDYLIVFHNDLQALLRTKLQAPEVQKDPYERAMIALYDKINSGNALLLTLGFLEEMLILFWRRRLPGLPLPGGASILRYKPLVQALGLSIGTMPCWAVLRDAYTVRNCLLHANGRISFMRDASAVRSCLTRHVGALEDNGDRLAVTSLFLQRCLLAIRELRDEMMGGLTSA